MNFRCELVSFPKNEINRIQHTKYAAVVVLTNLFNLPVSMSCAILFLHNHVYGLYGHMALLNANCAYCQ